MNPHQILEKELDLRPGDIIIYELPFEDPTAEDFFPFDSLKDFTPNHVAMWIDNGDKPLAHAVSKGEGLPGIRTTTLSPSKCVVFRSKDKEMSAEAAEIFKNWAKATKLYSKEKYLSTYPMNFWGSRHSKDINKFMSSATLLGPMTPYPQPRADFDLTDIARKNKNSILTEEGLRRAIKFASRRLINTSAISRGQRCSSILVAAVQASILAPIVKPYDSKIPFKSFKNKKFEEYADEVLIKGWYETDLGKKLLLASKNGDFSEIFPPAFAVDQRYVLPSIVFRGLKQDPSFAMVGRFSYFDRQLEITNKDEKTTEHFFNKNKLTK